MVCISLAATLCTAAVGLLQGLGSAATVAGFLGMINCSILAKEVAKAVGPTYEDWAFLLKMRKMGVIDLSTHRSELTNTLIESLRNGSDRLVIVGSSLRGFLGVGFDPSDADALNARRAIEGALERGTQVCILMMHPNVAHHRKFQEQREEGHIERNIIRNLMYLVKLRKDNKHAAEHLDVRLLRGIPSVFMACTSQLMLMNPYPTFGQGELGARSFSFLVEKESELYSQYLVSHFAEAWKTPEATDRISADFEVAKQELLTLIQSSNETSPSSPIIENKEIRDQLLCELVNL
jgi:hypothetical protein